MVVVVIVGERASGWVIVGERASGWVGGWVGERVELLVFVVVVGEMVVGWLGERVSGWVVQVNV
jgi:hypothetical protein